MKTLNERATKKWKIKTRAQQIIPAAVHQLLKTAVIIQTRAVAAPVAVTLDAVIQVAAILGAATRGAVTQDAVIPAAVELVQSAANVFFLEAGLLPAFKLRIR